MSTEIKQYANSDYFFYYGQIDIKEECRSDLWQLLYQPTRSMFFNRQEGGGVTEYENYPNAISLQVNLRLSISNAVSYRNSVVTDGFDGQKDRRIAVSQNFIGIEQKNDNLDLIVLFFLYSDYTNPQKINSSIGGFNGNE